MSSLWTSPLVKQVAT
jgi:hypothetical protein